MALLAAVERTEDRLVELDLVRPEPVVHLERARRPARLEASHELGEVDLAAVASAAGVAGSAIEQAQLLLRGDQVEVGVLALDQPALGRDHVDAAEADRLAGRLGDQAADRERNGECGGDRVLVDDQLADV